MSDGLIVRVARSTFKLLAYSSLDIPVVYGITTGFGTFANVEISQDDLKYIPVGPKYFGISRNLITGSSN